LYAISRDGIAKKTLEEESKKPKSRFSIKSFETIPAPKPVRNDSLQLLVANIDYNAFVGRLAIGRLFSGEIAKNQEVIVPNATVRRRKRGQRALRFSKE
jgi:GTP-binding protein